MSPKAVASDYNDYGEMTAEEVICVVADMMGGPTCGDREAIAIFNVLPQEEQDELFKEAFSNSTYSM